MKKTKEMMLLIKYGLRFSPRFFFMDKSTAKSPSIIQGAENRGMATSNYSGWFARKMGDY
jgi:hypothetical protein